MDDEPKQIHGATNRKVQVRKESNGKIGKATRNAFLGYLAQTANVMFSERLAGMSQGSAYGVRRRDAAFAEAWVEALEQGYAHIEAQLMACAIGRPAALEPDSPVVPFDPDMAIRVLTLRTRASHPNFSRGGPKIKRVSIEAVETSLRRRLDAMTRRLKVDL